MKFTYAPYCGARTLVFTGFALATASKKYTESIVRMASLTHDGQVEFATKVTPVDGQHAENLFELEPKVPKVDPNTAGREMLDAAQKESESSGSAKTKAKLMADAATKQTDGIKQRTMGKIDETLSTAKKDMATGLEKAMTSMKTSTTSEKNALIDTKKQVDAVVLALKSAKTNKELIVANEKTMTTCRDALLLSNKTMESFKTMSDSMHAEAARIKTVADKAGEDMEKYLADATKDVNVVANQLAEAALAVSAKMKANADANEISLLVTKAAENVKATAAKLAAEAQDKITTVRSSGREISEQLVSDAVNAKEQGDKIASSLADSTNAAMQDISTAKATWLSSDVDAMDKMSKKLSPTDEGLLSGEKPEPTDQASIGEKQDLYTRFVYVSAILTILTLTVCIVFHTFKTKA